MRPRVIPSLLIKQRSLYKTRGFEAPVYVGDPMNAIRIFNDKGADELVVLDIGATPLHHGPDFDFVAELATECFMPLAYGGGVRTVDEISRLVKLGVEKVVIRTAAIEDPKFIREAAQEFGSQSIVASIDVKKSWRGVKRVHAPHVRSSFEKDPLALARTLESQGAGEMLVTSVDAEGSMGGYDLELIRQIASHVNVPVIASGGAASLDDFRRAIREGGAAAVSAGAMFVFHGRHRAVLITYPSESQLDAIFA